jgi:hypothetical protein
LPGFEGEGVWDRIFVCHMNKNDKSQSVELGA